MPAEAWRALEGKSVLVTGASGFIGSALCRELARAGADVTATSRTPLVEPDVAWHGCDLGNFEAARKLAYEVQPQVILHLASHVSGARTIEAVPRTFVDNLSTTVNLLMVAQELGCERVVLTGSIEEPAPASDWSVPCSPYAAAKHAASAYGRMFHALYGLPVTTLRLSMVYGPGQRDLSKLVPYVITSLLRGETPLLGSGTREVDWVYVDDVVDAIAGAATAPDLAGLTLDVGSGHVVTVREVVEDIYELLCPAVAPSFGAVVDRPMEPTHASDVEATARRLNWLPKVALVAGLTRTVAWYTEHLASGQFFV